MDIAVNIVLIALFSSFIWIPCIWIYCYTKRYNKIINSLEDGQVWGNVNTSTDPFSELYRKPTCDYQVIVDIKDDYVLYRDIDGDCTHSTPCGSFIRGRNKISNDFKSILKGK